MAALFPDRVITIRGQIDGMSQAEASISAKLTECFEQDQSQNMVYIRPITEHGIYSTNHRTWYIFDQSQNMVYIRPITEHGIYSTNHRTWYICDQSQNLVYIRPITELGIYSTNHRTWYIFDQSQNLVYIRPITELGIYSTNRRTWSASYIHCFCILNTRFRWWWLWTMAWMIVNHGLDGGEPWPGWWWTGLGSGRWWWWAYIREGITQQSWGARMNLEMNWSFIWSVSIYRSTHNFCWFGSYPMFCLLFSNQEWWHQVFRWAKIQVTLATIGCMM